jgi:arabinose-5-phosphate isomerase
VSKTVAPDLALARKVLQTEAAAILALVDRLDDRFEQAVRLLLDCRGRVVVTGMGKSGLICRKIAATLSSTGTPAFFLHPAEAIHGDLGVLQSDDVILALSYSGETDELLRLLETIKRLGARLITITGVTQSTLGKAADVALDCHVSEEACPLNLVPTASTTAALALGDALAMTLLVARGFRPEDFANLHPGGKLNERMSLLGKRLMRANQLMASGEDAPIVRTGAEMREVIHEISRKKLGMSCVVDDAGRLVGIITDGDLRRHMADTPNLLASRAEAVMTRHPVTIGAETLAVEVLNTLERRKITAVVVVDGDQKVLGVVHLHDLWRTEMI